MARALPLIADVEPESERVSESFERGLRNALIIAVLFFWAPVIFLVAWLANT